MDELIGSKIINEQAQQKQRNLRAKYQAALADKKYKNLKNVPPHLQPHSKRFIDGKSKGLGTSYNSNAITTKYPPEMEAAINSLPDRSDYIRRAVLKQLHSDGLISNYELPESD